MKELIYKINRNILPIIILISIYLSTIFENISGKINYTHVVLIIVLLVVIMDLAKTWSVSKYLLYMIYGMFLSSIITIVLYENSLGDSLLRYIVFLPGPLLAILIIKKYRMEPELLDFIMKTTIMFILLASFIQLLAGSLGIEIIEFEHYRKREYIIPQI